MGSGFKTYNDGDVLTASDLNNYIQEQTVMSFATTTARDSAITSPEEGMLALARDTDVYYWYTGAAWTPLMPAGAWTAYTPAWTAATTNPAIGNGTILGRYAAHGKTVRVIMQVTMGSTTTYGSGQWRLGPPSGFDILQTVEQSLFVKHYDTSGATSYPGVGYSNSISYWNLQYSNPNLISATATAPFTWATGDVLRAYGTYETT